MKILITLPADRLKLGSLFALNDDGTAALGPFEADGKSDNAAAIAAGNPNRNPEQPYGDTPLGEYQGALAYEPDSPANQRSFGLPDSTGKIPTIALIPLPGPTQAWRAFLNHREGLKIHAGALNGTCLRPTHGCVRLREEDLTALLKWLGTAQCSVIIQQTQQATT